VALKHLLSANGHTTIKLEVGVLLMGSSVVESRFGDGGAEAFPDTIFVNTPHLIDTLVDFLVEGVASEQGGGDKPESDVLTSQFKNGCNKD